MTSINVSHKGMCDASTQLSAGADTVTTANTTTTTSRRGSRRIGKRLFAFAAALSLAAGTLTTVTPAAEAAAPKTTEKVTLRSGPGTSYAAKGTLKKGASITIVCYSKGTSVKGNTYWDKLSNGTYISDYYVNLGGKTPNKAGYKACPAAPSKPKPTVTTKKATVTAKVTVRAKPYYNAKSKGTLKKGASITIVCYVRASDSKPVGGNVWWDKLSNGTYVSDYYVNLGGYSAPEAGIKPC